MHPGAWVNRGLVLVSQGDDEKALEAFDHALEVARPDIFNTDQGAQCTSHDCTERLAAAGMLMSMDGRGRALDHVGVARRWRTVT